MDATTSEFALTARTLGRELRSRGLIAPGYRCPPRIVGLDRSLRRWESGATVSVRIKGRPLVAVVADMIEGAVVTNRLGSPLADRLRAELWSAVQPVFEVHSGSSATGAVRKVA